MYRIRDGLVMHDKRVSTAIAIALVVAWAILGDSTEDNQTHPDHADSLSGRQDSGVVSASSVPPRAWSTSGELSASGRDHDTFRRVAFNSRAASLEPASATASIPALRPLDRALRNDLHATGSSDGGQPGGFGADEYDTTAEHEDPDTADSENPVDNIERNSHISGSVLDQFGMAVAGIGLIATVRNLPPVPDNVSIPTEYLQYRTVSDVDGRYRFDRIISGDYSVSTVSEGQYANAQIHVRSGTALANIVLSRKHSIVVSGQVVTPAGEPLWGAVVTPLVSGVSGAYTDGAGKYRLAAAVAETRRGMGLKAKIDGYHEKMVLLNATDLGKSSITANFVLEPIASVAMVGGRVYDADGNAPLAGASVQLRSGRSNRLYRTVTGSAGEFLLNGVETGGDYQLMIRGSGGYQDFVQEHIQVNSSGLNLDIALDRASQNSLYAQVSNLGGQAIPGYTLSMRRASPPFNTMQVTSDGGGRFAIHGVSAGPLVFEKQSYPQVSISGVDIADNVDEHVQLVLDWGTDEINGVVIDESGRAVGGSTVLLTWAHSAHGIRSWSTRKTTADAQGNFGFRELGPGIHTLVVEAQGFSATRLAHNVTTDGYDVVVKLDPISIGTGSGS